MESLKDIKVGDVVFLKWRDPFVNGSQNYRIHNHAHILINITEEEIKKYVAIGEVPRAGLYFCSHLWNRGYREYDENPLNTENYMSICPKDSLTENIVENLGNFSKFSSRTFQQLLGLL